MSKEIKDLTSMYDAMINESIAPMTVKGSDSAVKTGDLPSDAKTKDQKGQGMESKAVKDVGAPEEADEDLSPAGKVTKDKKAKKEVTTIKDSTMKKSFMDMYSEIMEEAPDIEDPSFDDETGDFPASDVEDGYGEDEIGDEGMEEDNFAKLADLFSQAAELFKSMSGVEDEIEDDMGEELGDEMGDEITDMQMGGEQDPITGEATSAPEPALCSADFKKKQMPNKLGGDGVKVSSTTKAAAEKKKRNGELEDAPAGFKHDKSKMKVQGKGSAHKPKASFLED